ncbi:hypothetical protein CYMTET_26368, partial [Cymbomonas tetramitiformis]
AANYARHRHVLQQTSGERCRRQLSISASKLSVASASFGSFGQYNNFCGASNCIDGIKESRVHCRSGSSLCTSLAGHTNPWLQLDLGLTFAVQEVHVYNRLEACCTDRLGVHEIWVGSNPSNATAEGNALCGNDTASSTAISITHQCNGGSLPGRYVYLLEPGSGRVISLQEVEVFGSSLTVAPTTSGGITQAPVPRTRGFDGAHTLVCAIRVV